MVKRILFLGVLLFASGCCALVYQSVWLRSFRQVFGASTPSTAAVLAVWMGGLGLGGVWLGRRAQRAANPLRMVAQLELGIALTAAASPFLLMAASRVYLAVGGTATLGEGGASVVRLFLTALVLGVPAVLLGGTLPAAGRVVTGSEDLGRKGLALLYGINAVGAVVGVLLGTFVLFEAWGMQRTLYAACLLNGAVALAAWRLSQRLPADEELPVDDAPSGERPLANVEAIAPSRGEGEISRAWLLSAAFAAGFCFLLLELVWYRMASPILGGSTYTFGLVLGVALGGIGLGGLVYAWWGPSRATPGLFAVTCGLEALAIVFPLVLGDDLALLADMLRAFSTTFASRVLGWAAVTLILVFPAALVAGFQFPLLLALKGRGSENVATDVGEIYAANTAGAILGSLAGGFGLLPLLSAPGAWRASALLLLPMGAYFAITSRLRQPLHALAFALLSGACALGVISPGPGPVWRHSGIGAGESVFGSLTTWNERQAKRLTMARGQLSEFEGRESSLAFRVGDSLSLAVNGKSDGNAINDAQTQVLLGLIGAILHPEPRRAFVVGLGTGQTAGWLAEVPSMDHVEVVELEPGVIEFARLCALSNHDVVEHAKVKIAVGDGREALQTSRAQFDLIASEPSNPYRAGMAGFYSADFYRQARARLAPGGYFLQWIQTYELDGETLFLALATLRSVFPHVTVWRLKTPGDVLFTATLEPQTIDLDRVTRRLAEEPYRTGLGRIAGIYDPEGFLALHLANHRLADQALATLGEDLNTDDRNRLEYGIGRTVGVAGGISEDDIRRAVQLTRASAPAVGGEFDQHRVDLLRARMYQACEAPVPSFPTDQPRRLELWRAISRGELDRARRLAPGVPPPPPHDLFERLIRIELHVGASPKSAAGRQRVFGELQFLAKRGYGADAACLRLLAVLADPAQELVPSYSKLAFEWARKDPWLSGALLQRTLRMLQVRVTDPAVAKAVCEELLLGSFAVYSKESWRLTTALRLAIASLEGPLIARVMRSFEPFPLWDKTLLKLRAKVYKKAGSALGERARHDLELYLSHDRREMGELLGQGRVEGAGD